MVPATHQPALTTPKVWNDLVPGDPVIIDRVVKSVPITCVGIVTLNTRKRNCYMLQVRIEEAFDRGGNPLSRWDLRTAFGTRVLPVVVEWKNNPQTKVTGYDPAKVLTAAQIAAAQRAAERRAKKLDNTDLDELLQKKAQQRNVYANHRNLLQEARNNAAEAFNFVNLSPSCSYEEFRTVRKKVMRQWHPDSEMQHVLVNGEESREVFRQTSARYLEVFSLLDTIIKQRDSLEMKYEGDKTNV